MKFFLYELLNEANIDVNKIEVSELERAKGKKGLMESIQTTPKGGRAKNKIAK